MAKQPIPEYTGVWVDWKEDPGTVVQETIEAINKLLAAKKLDVHIEVNDDPNTEGSDTYGFIFTTEVVGQKMLKRIAKDELSGDES